MQLFYVGLFDTIFIAGTCIFKFKLISGKLCDFDIYIFVILPVHAERHFYS